MYSRPLISQLSSFLETDRKSLSNCSSVIYFAFIRNLNLFYFNKSSADILSALANF